MVGQKPLVIFDCDGVLVDSETIAAEVLSQGLSRFNLPLPIDECLKQFKGHSMKACLTKLQDLLGCRIDQEFLSDLQEETYRRFQLELQAISGVESAISMLQRWGISTCVASSGSHEKMRISLGKTGLAKFFRGRIFSANEVKQGKPAPDIFLHAARTMGFEPSACIVVEDSLPGVKAGEAAGMQVLAYGDDPLLAQHLPLSTATVAFNDMSVLPDLVKSMIR